MLVSRKYTEALLIKVKIKMILGYLKLLRFPFKETCVKSSNDKKNSLFKFFNFSHHCLIFFPCCFCFFLTHKSVPDGSSKDPMIPAAGSNTSPKWMLQKTEEEHTQIAWKTLPASCNQHIRDILRWKFILYQHF